MMDEVLAIILVTWFVTATVVSAQFAIVDYRDFGNIVKQCEKQGFIQDKTIRVSCSVDK
jgi:hypothetical protein